jgi:hypothetical protein
MRKKRSFGRRTSSSARGNEGGEKGARRWCSTPFYSRQGGGRWVRGERVRGSRGLRPPAANGGGAPRAWRGVAVAGGEMTPMRRGSRGRRGADMRARATRYRCVRANEWDPSTGCCGPPWAAAVVGLAQ